jgi:hypothetical protein
VALFCFSILARMTSWRQKCLLQIIVYTIIFNYMLLATLKVSGSWIFYQKLSRCFLLFFPLFTFNPNKHDAGGPPAVPRSGPQWSTGVLLVSFTAVHWWYPQIDGRPTVVQPYGGTGRPTVAFGVTVFAEFCSSSFNTYYHFVTTQQPNIIE